jgi:hypothetical protein
MARCAAMRSFIQSRAALETGFSSPPHSLHTASAAHLRTALWRSRRHGEGDSPHFRNTVPDVERPLSLPAPNVASGRLWAPIRICAVSDSHFARFQTRISRGFRLAFRAVSDSHFARFQTRISRGFRLAFHGKGGPTPSRTRQQLRLGAPIIILSYSHVRDFL